MNDRFLLFFDFSFASLKLVNYSKCAIFLLKYIKVTFFYNCQFLEFLFICTNPYVIFIYCMKYSYQLIARLLVKSSLHIRVRNALIATNVLRLSRLQLWKQFFLKYVEMLYRFTAQRSFTC